jgi:hypothetical protein
LHGPVLGSPPGDGDLKSEIVDHFAQEVAAAKKWFDERQPKVGSGQCQRYPGQTGSTTYVGDLLTRSQQLSHRSTIQYVPIP